MPKISEIQLLLKPTTLKKVMVTDWIYIGQHVGYMCLLLKR